MKDKTKNIVLISVFLLIIGTFFLTTMFLPAKDVSYSERRKLKQPKVVTLENIFDGSYFSSLDGIMADQFAFREQFRKLKAGFHFYAMNRADNNDIYIENGNAIKIETTLRENSIKKAAEKFLLLKEQYFPKSNIYISIIPDKSYYSSNENLPRLDYEKLVGILKAQTDEHLYYIDIAPALSLSSYYNTDLHWRQEKLEEVVKSLELNMEFEAPFKYEVSELKDFLGVYSGQSALPLPAEPLYYLENETTKGALVKNHETGKDIPVYSPELFEGIDPYDVYLSGATPLLTIKNPNVKEERELILIRDSFGSSLAPLLIEAYSTIHIVDFRYIDSSLLKDYIEITDQEVLIMLSASVLNNSDMLKISELKDK